MKKALGPQDMSALRNAAEKAHGDDRDYKRAANIDFILYLLVVIFSALAIRSFIGEPVRVEGSSMFPNLHDGERMVIEKFSYDIGEPKRGDVVVCFYPGFTVSCVKRVIALPGESIEIVDGEVYINGVKLDESEYIINEKPTGDMSERVVKDGHVFVMGDNRNHSTDSRSKSVGDIPYEKIVGRVFCVIWPVSEIRGIG